MQGNVTDVQRFSLNDGNGIRTTVFLKGCNMHCEWCHNPETIDFKNNVMLYEKNCIKCGKCFEVCPNGAQIIENGVHKIDAEKCVSCGKCVSVCYAEALKFSAKKMSVEDIIFEVMQDMPYYEESNGGVTISGGEAFCQTEFVDAIAKECNKLGIDIAVETNLLHDFDKIEETLKKLDMVMFDIKIFDDEIHKKYTGVSNKLVLENAVKLDKLGIPMIVRTPLIPNVTDDIENLTKIAEFASTLKNVKYYELLNFNPLGAIKYEALNKENDYHDEKPLNNAKLDAIKEALKQYKIKIS